MEISDVIWLDRFVEKLAVKHGVAIDEVEEVLLANPFVRRVEKGRVAGEDMYSALGQTRAGRYLIVFFIRKSHGAALPISARDMTPAERRYYGHQKH